MSTECQNKKQHHVPEKSKQNQLSFWAILVIAANTLNGPAITTLPSIANSAGSLFYISLVGAAAFVTCFVLRRLCNLLWRTPSCSKTSNETATSCDLVTLTDHFFGQKALASLVIMFCALVLAVSQMMICAAILDSVWVILLGKTCALDLKLSPVCSDILSMKPFDSSNAVSLFSAGTALASAITIGLASVDLDSMITAQYVLFGCLLIACARFCFTLHDMGVEAAFNWSGNTGDRWQSYWGPEPLGALGPILMSFAFVVTAPPLATGAASCSEAKAALVTASLGMAFIYVMIGVSGAAAADSRPLDDNLLSLVLRGTDPGSLDFGNAVAVVLFGLSQLAAIPVYCQLAQNTLQSHLEMPLQTAYISCHILPWALVALTYNGAIFEDFVDWSSLLLLGFANFSWPLLLEHHCMNNESNEKHHIPGSGPDAVLWGLALITATIAAVIVQRITQSMLMAESTFMAVTLMIFRYEHGHMGSLLPLAKHQAKLDVTTVPAQCL